jgi:hypothetical protein
MTDFTRAELDKRLASQLTEEVERIMATTDVQRQLDRLESHLGKTRQRRPAILVIAAAVAAGVVALTAILLTRGIATHPHTQPAAPSLLPQPVAQELKVYQGVGSRPGSTERVYSFIDTKGQWCVADLDSAVTAGPSNYKCRATSLPANGHGFGAVYSVADSPSYDNFHSWFGGVATADVARVTMVFSDGRTAPAQLLAQGSAHAVVFSVSWPTLTDPTFYRAYGADGHLIQQLPIPAAQVP